jgi:hypothetical protein
MEIMIAMTVLLLVFMSALAGLTIGFRMLEEARTSTLASQVLQSEIENLRLKNWTQLSAMPATEPFSVEVDTTLSGFPNFVCTRSIYTVQSDMKEAVLTVAWTAKDGRARSRRYITYLAKGGINDYFYRRF